MFRKVLIANRGEVVSRVLRTLKRLKISSVCIYDRYDRDALYLKECDESYPLPDDEDNRAHLNMEAILKIAKESGAQAIHPGYGFLAENAEFSKLCFEAGIKFIGASPESISEMGEKGRARDFMKKAGLSVLEGYQGKDQSLETMRNTADQIGYPVLLKASLGGGGKGMRLVESREGFDDALKIVKREALKLFKDDHIVIERYLENPRHIEVQVLGDGRGHALHFYERECSIQRRHQKIIEEAPANRLSEATRQKICEAAVKGAESLLYEGAGTFEFLVDAEEHFYFMEMNTRLQVEHPVTEMITGVDLVECQLRVAAKEPLHFKQADIKIKGHAIEARICVEDPLHDFMPAIGTVERLDYPQPASDLRIENALEEGSIIEPRFDSMVAKIIAWGEDRTHAIRRLSSALASSYFLGVKTNIAFIQAVLREKDFMKGYYTTHYIQEHKERLFEEMRFKDDYFLIMALLFFYYCKEGEAHQKTPVFWSDMGGFRMHHSYPKKMLLSYHDQDYACVIAEKESGLLDVTLGGAVYQNLSFRMFQDDLCSLTSGDRIDQGVLFKRGNKVDLFMQGRHQDVRMIDLLTPKKESIVDDSCFKSPMPGKIIEMPVKDGDFVRKGQALVILEAMKTEHTIAAPFDGYVVKSYVKQGDQTAEGVRLLDFNRDDRNDAKAGC